MRTRERENQEEVTITFETTSGSITARPPAHVMGRPSWVGQSEYDDKTYTTQWIGVRRPAMQVVAILPDGTNVSVDIPSRDWERLAGNAAWGSSDFPTVGYLPGQAEYYEDILDAILKVVSSGSRAQVTPCGYASVFGPSVYERKQTSDVVTPRFHTLQKKGQLIFNPFDSEEIRYTSTWSSQTIPSSREYDPPSSYPSTWPRSWGSATGLNDSNFSTAIPWGTGLTPSLGNFVGSSSDPYRDLGQSSSSKNGGVGTLRIVSLYSPSVYEALEKLMSSEYVLERVREAPLQFADVAGSSLEEVYDRINDSEAELATELAELPETLKHLYSVITRFSTLVRTIKRPEGLKKMCSRTWSHAKRTLTTKLNRRPSNAEIAAYIYSDLFSSAWLEARYAWRPLIITAEQIIRGYDTDRPPRRTFFGVRSDQDSSSVDNNHFNGTLSARSGALCEAGNLSSGNVLGLYNFGTAALELIPFSFVVGWFVNLSAVAASLNPSPIYTTRGSWTTLRRTVDFSFEIYRPGDDPLLEEIVTEPIMVSGTLVRQTRTINPERSFFSIDLNLDGSKFTDLAALLRQLAS